MKRRTFLNLAGSAMLYSVLPPMRLLAKTISREYVNGIPRIFFLKGDIERIKRNARGPFLKPYFDTWADMKPDKVRETITKVAKTHELVHDWASTLVAVQKQSVLYLVTGNPVHKQLVELGIQTAVDLPKWDYFLDGHNQPIGIMRSTLATQTLLFAREVLGGELDPKKDEQLLHNIAEKGCLPAYRSLWGLHNPDKATGWHFDKASNYLYDITTRNWPHILNHTNLKAVMVMGLGIGSVALEHKDKRAEGWLKMAEKSAKEYFTLIETDGSYPEGLSYLNYALQSILSFCEAHYLGKGTIDWYDQANFYGSAEFITAMQLGWDKFDDRPDLVNFSDANSAIQPSMALWMANHGKDKLAQFNAVNFSNNRSFLDFLWYQPDNLQIGPYNDLKNKRMDLDWIVTRTGWAADDSILAFRSGKPANHEHADRNSFIFKTHGERLLTDHFHAAYDWRQPGWLLRLTEAHNSILIDGKGHEYVKGNEGTNSSEAVAKIVRYVDHQDVVWWSSDATQAYQLVIPDVRKVMRTLLFVKPYTIIMFDQIEKHQTPSRISARFHPDNRDGQAALDNDDNGAFTIHRPHAVLYGQSACNHSISIKQSHLNLPGNMGYYPFIEIETDAALHQEIVTVMIAKSDDIGTRPSIKIKESKDNWTVQMKDKSAYIMKTGYIPEILWKA